MMIGEIGRIEREWESMAVCLVTGAAGGRRQATGGFQRRVAATVGLLLRRLILVTLSLL